MPKHEPVRIHFDQSYFDDIINNDVLLPLQENNTDVSSQKDNDVILSIGSNLLWLALKIKQYQSSEERTTAVSTAVRPSPLFQELLRFQAHEYLFAPSDRGKIEKWQEDSTNWSLTDDAVEKIYLEALQSVREYLKNTFNIVDEELQNFILLLFSQQHMAVEHIFETAFCYMAQHIGPSAKDKSKIFYSPKESRKVILSTGKVPGSLNIQLSASIYAKTTKKQPDGTFPLPIDIGNYNVKITIEPGNVVKFNTAYVGLSDEPTLKTFKQKLQEEPKGDKSTLKSHITQVSSDDYILHPPISFNSTKTKIMDKAIESAGRNNLTITYGRANSLTQVQSNEEAQEIENELNLSVSLDEGSGTPDKFLERISHAFEKESQQQACALLFQERLRIEELLDRIVTNTLEGKALRSFFTDLRNEINCQLYFNNSQLYFTSDPLYFNNVVGTVTKMHGLLCRSSVIHLAIENKNYTAIGELLSDSIRAFHVELPRKPTFFGRTKWIEENTKKEIFNCLISQSDSSEKQFKIIKAKIADARPWLVILFKRRNFDKFTKLERDAHLVCILNAFTKGEINEIEFNARLSYHLATYHYPTVHKEFLNDFKSKFLEQYKANERALPQTFAKRFIVQLIAWERLFNRYKHDSDKVVPQKQLEHPPKYKNLFVRKVSAQINGSADVAQRIDVAVRAAELVYTRKVAPRMW